MVEYLEQLKQQLKISSLTDNEYLEIESTLTSLEYELEKYEV